MSDQNEQISITLRANIGDFQRAALSAANELQKVRTATADVERETQRATAAADSYIQALTRKAVMLGRTASEQRLLELGYHKLNDAQSWHALQIVNTINAYEEHKAQMASNAAMMSRAAVAAAGLSSAFIYAAKQSIDAADGLNDLSQKTGFSVERLVGYKLIAEQSGTTTEGLALAVKNLSKFMVEHGDVLKKHGITAKDADSALVQLADVFKALPDGIEKAALSMKLFGRHGTDMIPVVNLGSEEIETLITRSHALSSVTSESAKRADEFNDRMTELKTVVQSFVFQVVTPALPLMTELVKTVTDSGKSSENAAGGFSILTETMRAGAVLFGNVKFVLNGIGTELGGIAAQAAALGRGDFKAFSAIGQMMREDAEKARADFDAWENRILEAGKTPTTSEATVDPAAAKRAMDVAVGIAGPAPKKTKKGKADKKKKPQLSTEEAALLDEWSSAVIREDIGDAKIALQDRDDELTMMAQAQRERRVERIEADLMSDRDREQLAFAERMAFLQSARTQELAEAEQHGLDQMEIHARYAKLMEGITVQQLQTQQMRNSISAALMAQGFQDAYTVMSVMGQKHTALAKALFIAGKAAAISQIFIDTQLQAAKAGAQTGLFGIPMQAYIEAAGYARMAAVAATGWQEFRAPSGGGGIGGSLSAGGSGGLSGGGGFVVEQSASPATRAQAAAPARQFIVDVSNSGPLLSKEWLINNFMGPFGEALRDGAGPVELVVRS